MAAKDVDLIPSLAAFCASSPSAARAAAITSDSGHGSDHNRLASSRSSTPTNTSHSHHSHRLSVASSRHSVSSIRSHVSSFQNVRFDPDPIKDISFWGGLALLISNMTGPGLVTLPIVAHSAGWLPTILGFGVAGMLSALSSLFICEAMTEVSGNEHFQSNVEFSNLILCFFGRRYHLLVQIICFLAMQVTNIASIAVSAQLFDNLLIKIFHRTCGVQVYPDVAWVCVTEGLQASSPFTGIMIMTAGILVSFSMVLPLGLLKLSENIWVQLASFGLIIFIVMQWIVTFCMHGLDTTLVPVIGSDISQAFGTILFNYAFITTVPSWANAKQPGVSIHKTIGWSVGITTTLYLAVAILGGMAYKISSDSSLIQAISSSPDATVLSQITGYTFPIAALITSIPINTIVIRYNLIQSGTCNHVWANLWAGVFPWLIAIPCMTGSGLASVINWCSLLLVSVAQFIIPLILYIHSKKHREKLSKLPIIEMEQQERLSREVSRMSLSGHSARNTTISNSVRRRLTGSSFRWRSESHPDLTISPPIGIAAATVVPVVVGIGNGSLVQRGSAESLVKEQQPHSITNGPSSANDKGDISGPYFTYSLDGELFECELPTTPSQGPSQYHPPSESTVVLHDPISEMAQRKTSLPRRVSHKDRILSMISEKHKRVVEQQAKRIEEEQCDKPVPPMILLSQTAPENDDDNLARSSDSNELESYSEGGFQAPSKDSMETGNDDPSPSKRLIRKSSVPPPKSIHRSTLDLPSLSPTTFKLNPWHDIKENALELSPMLSLPLSTTTPTNSQESLKSSYLSSPKRLSPGEDNGTMPRPSITLSLSPPRDELRTELTPISARPSIRVDATTGSSSTHTIPSPNSAMSANSLERRVSFPDGVRLSVPALEPGRKPSFGDGTKRLVKATPYAGTRPDSLGRMAAAFVAQPGSFSIQTEALNTLRLPTRAVKEQTKADTDQGRQQGMETPRSSSTLSPSAPPSSQPDATLNGRIRSRTVSASATLQHETARSTMVSGRTHSMQSLKEKNKTRSSNQLTVPDPANLLVHLMPPPSAPPSPQKSLSYQPAGGRNIRMSASAKSLTAPFQGGYNYSIPGFGSNHSSTSSPLHPPPSPGQQSLYDPLQSAQSVGSSWFNWRRHSREPSRSTTASAEIPHHGGSNPPSPHPSILDTGVGQDYGDRLPEPPDSALANENEGASTGSMDMDDIERRKCPVFNTNLHGLPHALEDGQVYDTMKGLRAMPGWVPISSLKIAWTSLTLLVVVIAGTIVYDFVQLALGNDVMSGS